MIVGISIRILVCLFMVQRFGTNKVGYNFAPIICVWFLFVFADVGHFSVSSIQISMCVVTYPALILAYTRQAPFLRKHNQYDYVSDAFFKSIPGPMYWLMFVVAVLAAIIASQAMISGTFSIVQQSLSLGCFPRTTAKIINAYGN
ncbi:hypothetical protein CsSME_00032370 [Camellia sinensis var. sinensis]